MNWNNCDVCVVVECIKHRDLSQQILTCIRVCTCNILICISHQWSIEGLRNTSVKQQSGNTKSKHGITFVQFLHDSNHHLVVGLFGQFIQESVNLIVVWVIFLTHLAMQGDQCEFSPVYGDFLNMCPANSWATKGGFKGDLQF